MTRLFTDYMGHIDDVSVWNTHFQIFIGTCNFFYFAFPGLTSNIDAPTKLQYALWNKGYKIHLRCLQCLLTHCYCTIQWGQQLVTRAPMQPQHWGNVTTCHIGINAKPFHEPPPHTWALNHYICLAMLMQVASSGSLKFHTLPIQTVTYVPFSELENVTWSVGTTYCIRINAKALHLAPHKNNPFVPQGS